MRAVKDKIYENAAKMLTNEVRGILKSKSAVSPIPTSSPSPESESAKAVSILKSSPANGFHNSSSEDEGVSTDSAETSDSDTKNEENKGSSSEKENSNEVESENKKNALVSEEVRGLVEEKENGVEVKKVSVLSEVIDVEVKSKVRRHLEEVRQVSSSTEGTPQTSDGESSGGREVKKIISNEAVARRRQAAINRQKEK